MVEVLLDYNKGNDVFEVLLDYNKGNDVFYMVRAEMLQAGQFEVTS
jgi:hypothetical protein